jgi:hypothetical protein
MRRRPLLRRLRFAHFTEIGGRDEEPSGFLTVVNSILNVIQSSSKALIRGHLGHKPAPAAGLSLRNTVGRLYTLERFNRRLLRASALERLADERLTLMSWSMAHFKLF